MESKSKVSTKTQKSTDKQVKKPAKVSTATSMFQIFTLPLPEKGSISKIFLKILFKISFLPYDNSITKPKEKAKGAKPTKSEEVVKKAVIELPTISLKELNAMIKTFNDYKTEENEYRTSLVPINQPAEEDQKDDEEDDNGEDNQDEEGSEEEDDEDFALILDFKDDWCHDLIEQVIGKYKLPHITEIYIDSLEDVNSNVVKFCQSCITTCDRLFINKKPLQKHVKEKIDINFYLDCLLKVLPKITALEGSCLIGYMSITSSQFNKIMKASSQLEFLSFNCCKLHFDEGLNFEIDSDYKIRVIALTGCGHGFNGGILNEHSFKHFITALAKSSIKDSLKQLSITWCNISSETVNGILAEHNLEDISIWA